MTLPDPTAFTCPPWCVEDEDLHDRDGEVCRTHRCHLGEGRVIVHLVQCHWSDEPAPEPVVIQVDYAGERVGAGAADIEFLTPRDAGTLVALLHRAGELAGG